MIGISITRIDLIVLIVNQKTIVHVIHRHLGNQLNNLQRKSLYLTKKSIIPTT